MANQNIPNGAMRLKKPIPNRRIHLFQKCENRFACPCCRIHYIHDVRLTYIKQVFATKHMKDKGEDVVHHITDPMGNYDICPIDSI